jgi:hypothetical protein
VIGKQNQQLPKTFNTEVAEEKGGIQDVRLQVRDDRLQQRQRATSNQ